MWPFDRKPKKQKAQASPGPRRSYDAANNSWRTDGWITGGGSANAETMDAIAPSRERARDLRRNAGWGKAAVDKVVVHLVAGGLMPDVDTGDAKLDAQALKLFGRWAKRCCPDGTNFWAAQTMLARELVEGGEVLGRRRSRFMADMQDHHGQLPPIQVQILEGDQLDHGYNTPRHGNRIIQGVEFDPLDRRVAYHFLPYHPGDPLTTLPMTLTAFNDHVRVQATNVFHLYDPSRAGQVRGVTWLHAIVQAIWDLSGYTDAERVRAKSAACMVGSVEGGDPEEGEPEGVDGTAPAKDATGNLVTDSAGMPVEQAAPGLIMYAPNGKKIVWNQAGVQSNADWVRVQLREAAAGIGLSYESYSGDFSQGNFSFSKLGQAEQRAMFRALREQLFAPMALDPFWSWFIDGAIAAGLLPDVPELYDVTWSDVQIESADRAEDARADILEMRAGLRSRPAIIRSRGQDPDTVDAEIAKDQEARAALGIVSDGDPSQTSMSGALQPPDSTTGDQP